MGRELRRVPIDFNWPVNKTWEGFLNPYYRECPHCKAGYSPSYDIVAKHINGLMWDQATREDKNVAAITTFLCGRSPDRGFFGHDSSDAWSAITKIGKLAGLPESWTACGYCHGEGIDPLIKESYEEWEPTGPPTGEGYQIWETVSEGSPISPVFATPEELARYMATTRFGADQGTSYEAWLEFINNIEWAPSFVVCDGKMMSGVEAVTKCK